MSDPALPRPDLVFLGRVAAFFLALGLAFALLLYTSGCSSVPAPLTVADIASNSAADEINAATAKWKRTVMAEAVRAELACKMEDMACRQSAVQSAERAHAAEEHALVHLAITQNIIQDALTVARTCQKAQDQACAGAALGAAVTTASELRGLMADYHREHPLCHPKIRSLASSASPSASSLRPCPAPRGPS